MSDLTRHLYSAGTIADHRAAIEAARAIEISSGTATVAGVVLDVPGDLAPGTYSIDELLRVAGAKTIPDGVRNLVVESFVTRTLLDEVDQRRREQNRWDERLPEVRDWRRRQGGR